MSSVQQHTNRIGAEANAVMSEVFAMQSPLSNCAVLAAGWAEQSAAVLSAGWAEECLAEQNNHRYYRY